jgi:AraC-like DNA-binding protein
MRVDWASDFRNAFQCFVGDVIDGDPTCVEAGVLRLRKRLSLPANNVERMELRQSLAVLLDRAARTCHQRFHVNFSRGECAVLPPEIPAQYLNPEISNERLLDEWTLMFTRWFSEHHILPPALRVKCLLEDRFAEPHTLETLARASGCCPRVLTQQFQPLFGLTPSEYLARVRVAEAMRYLRAFPHCVEEAARHAGYQSANKFYARLRRYTELRPSQVRLLTDAEFNQIVKQRLSVRYKHGAAES